MCAKGSKGFTVIEILIVVFVSAILFNIVVFIGRDFNNSVNLKNSEKGLEMQIKSAKARSVGALNGTHYGVHFEAGKAVVFPGSVYVAGNPENDIYDLPKDIEIYNINLEGGGSDLIFNRLTGTTDYFGTVGVRIKNNLSKTKQVTINQGGQIGLNSFPTSPDSPIKNSRHVHFELGWNIQNASNLKLEWVNKDTLVPITTSNIDTSSYFNADKSEFDWSGKTNVAGVDQELRIHSWLDVSSNTVLCVMRSQTENEKLIIYFDDPGSKIIASYINNGDGTVTVTPEIYGGTMQEQ